LWQLFKGVCRGYGTGVDVGDVLRAVLKLVRTYQVRVDVNYATLLINLLCIEGIAGSLEPSYNVLDQARPLLEPHSNRFIRPLFRRVFPLLLSAKRNTDALQFKIARAARQAQVQQQQRQEQQQQQQDTESAAERR
jgi:aarF domain-containing kinase